MASTICIMTPQGLKCSASDIKDHFPLGHPANCDKTASVVGLDPLVLTPFRNALMKTDIPKTQREAILRVVQLIVTADANEDTPFTIVNVPA